MAENGLYQPARKRRWPTLVLIVLAHAAAIFGLAHAFAPDLTDRAIDAATSVLTVNITSPEPEAPPSPEPDQGAGGQAGDKATPRDTSAPQTEIPVRSDPPAPRASSTGMEDRSGASRGEGTGGSDLGPGTGAGNRGAGQGGGIATKAVHITGTIEGSATDFPIPPGGREVRIGRSVIIALTLGTDGLPKGCRIYRSSGLPETDARTCELAMQRLRFRPAMNARGEPVVSTFYWQQRFFD